MFQHMFMILSLPKGEIVRDISSHNRNMSHNYIKYNYVYRPLEMGLCLAQVS